VKPLVIAHRGDSAHRPENTLASFASALEVGAELVELDVQLSRDGHPVVIHDPTVDRTTNGRGRVDALDLAELRALSAGYPQRFGDRWAGERVPTLTEALAFLRGRARVMIEIKHDDPAAASGELEARTVAEVRRAQMLEDCAFLSFSRQALLRCRELAPEVARGHTFYRATVAEVLDGARATGAAIVLPEQGMLDDALVGALRGAGLRVATWVVDRPEALKALGRFDLYGVGSNDPGALIAALEGGLLD
jgi:glycerophosphoryl diester phosphodiesterase